MYLAEGITGRSLASGLLTLTFDDGPGITDPGGPGPRTLELAEYLSEEEIPATFFVVGKHIEQYPEVIARLKALGHLVGNHSYHHPNLVHLASLGGDVHAELAMTSALIGHEGRPTLMRPPYGAWSPAVAETLNQRALHAARSAGPVMWDIDGRDWECWSDRLAPQTAAARYLHEVESAGGGIVLMHDSTADSRLMMGRNRTFEMVRVLVPRLRERDYNFVALEAVPEVAHAMAQTPSVELGPPFDDLRAELRAGDKAVLRTTAGEFLVADEGGGGRLRLSTLPQRGEEIFDIVPVGDSATAFRAATGHYLTHSTEEPRLTADVRSIGSHQVFGCALRADAISG